MVIWNLQFSSKIKKFSAKVKTGWEKKMSLLNFDQYEYSQSSLLLQHNIKWSRQTLSIFGPAPAGREMCVQYLSESAAAGDGPLLGQSHSTAHTDTAECSHSACTLLEIQFGKWKIFLWNMTSDPNYSDLSLVSSRHFVFRSKFPFPVCSGGPASTHSSERGCCSASAAWEKWRLRH